ncbi:hypothetical protein JH146_1132 [Methanocaldococcus bathoardescens]|uniref:Uncharacterized protein n=1 Tax=Methanocaldococcus bathoardescens TaxID=1301915 RepID=A0A076LC21_9EURY|nr:hypothetical protein [Methanocaldococcus bathoardescens]AIJ05975.1 hypothetical protein JH146_1132 [Methanocaldococcus bathoardescens]
MRKFFAIFLFFSLLNLSFAWDDCPFGKTNSSCYYPGECGRYIDTNNNGICDHSEPAPEANTNLNVQAIDSNNIQLTEELIDEYVDISGKELKSYTIKEICNKYGINPKCLKEKLKIDVSDDTTFDEIKKIYGIPPSVVKEAIVECMIEEGKIKLNITQNSSDNGNIINNNSKNTSIIDEIISFLFSTINLRDLLFGWL